MPTSMRGALSVRDRVRVSEREVAKKGIRDVALTPKVWLTRL